MNSRDLVQIKEAHPELYVWALEQLARLWLLKQDKARIGRCWFPASFSHFLRPEKLPDEVWQRLQGGTTPKPNWRVYDLEGETLQQCWHNRWEDAVQAVTACLESGELVLE